MQNLHRHGRSSAVRAPADGRSQAGFRYRTYETANRRATRYGIFDVQPTMPTSLAFLPAGATPEAQPVWCCSSL